MKQISSVSVLTLLVGLALVPLAALVSPRGADARPCRDGYYVYYSDATYTRVVGEKYLDCAGQLHREGEQTSYWRYWSYCCDNSSCSVPGSDYACYQLEYGCSHQPCPPWDQ